MLAVPARRLVVASPSGFNVLGLPGLRGWYNAKRLGLSEGSAVSAFTDLSSGGGNLSQGTGAKQFVYRAAGINSRPAIESDGVDDVLEGAAVSNFITNSAYTLFAVAQILTANTNNATTYLNDGLIAEGGGFFGVYVKNNAGAHTAHAFNWDANDDNASVSVSATDPFVVSSRHEAGSLFVSVNGGADSSVASGNTQALTQPLRIGLGYNTTPNYIAARWGEIIICNQALSPAQIAGVVKYLKSGWGVA